MQKYGKPRRVPPARLAKLQAIGREYGLWDIRADNILLVDGVFKIVDANPSRRRHR